VQIREVQKKHRDYGYRRTHAELTNNVKGVLNHKRVHRVWREYGLQHPVRRRCKRGKKGQVPLQARYPNHVWTYDFMQDATQDGRMLRALTLVDEYTRRGFALELRRSFKARDVIAALQLAFAEHGAPVHLRSDNGPEFIAQALKDWLAQAGVKTHYIDPGSPWQNAFGESFNATVRREHLNKEVFANLAEAQVLSALWLRYYNTERRHTSLDNITPEQYYKQSRPLTLESKMGLPHPADPQGREKAAGAPVAPVLQPCVFGPATALGLLPSIALSSGRADNSLTPAMPPA
jgi:transposase InsO family protein